MDVREYDNFDLAIEASGDGGSGFEARVLDSPAGEAAATFELPFTPEGLENFTLRMAAGRNVVRRMGSSHTARARDFGRDLYGAVFSGEVETCFHRSLDAADREVRGLRIRLRSSHRCGSWYWPPRPAITTNWTLMASSRCWRKPRRTWCGRGGSSCTA